jgi:chromosomal replication initiation ATPase DnaA
MADALDMRLAQAKQERARLLELATIEAEIAQMTARLAVTKSQVLAKEITMITASFFDVAPAAVRSQIRTPAVVEARQTAMFFLHTLCNLGCAEVGRLMDRDHGTVLHAIKTVRNRCDVEPLFKKCIESLKAVVKDRIERKPCVPIQG